MVDEGFLERNKSVGPEDSEYGLGRKGVEALRRRDGIQVVKGKRRFELNQVKVRRGRIWQHEKGLMEYAGRLAESGLTVHAGIRCWQNILGGKALNPDAVVWFENGPFGPGWHYVEYERYARQPSQVTRKLRGYLAEERRDNYPVLFIVGAPRIEELFHAEAGPGQLDLVTTTFKRLGSARKNKEPVWSYYGRPVELG